MRVLLVSTNTEPEPYPVYPLGVSVLASALTAAGHHVAVEDARLWGEGGSSCTPEHPLGYTPEHSLEHTPAYSPKCSLAHAIKRSSPDVIGLSLRNVDNTDSFTSDKHWALDSLAQLVAECRAHSNVPIVLGGAGFSIMPEAILAYCKADYGVAGEGEKSFCDLLALLEKGETPPSILRACSPCIGAEMASPSYDTALLRYYAKACGVVNLQTKRGCPAHCLYCTYPLIEGRTVRARDPEAVIDDIKRLQREVSFEELFFTDAVFNDTDGQWLALVEGMARAGIHVPWTAFFQPRGLDAAMLALCKKTGLKAVEFGTDAASDTTLHGLCKDFSFAEVHRSTALCVDLRLAVAHYVIFGGPGENRASLAEGLANVEALPTSLVFAFHGIRVYPDSPLMRLAHAEGAIAPGTDALKPLYYFSPQIDPAATEAAISASFHKNRLRIFPLEQGQEKLRVLRRMGLKGILWDKLIRFPKEPAL